MIIVIWGVWGVLISLKNVNNFENKWQGELSSLLANKGYDSY